MIKHTSRGFAIYEDAPLARSGATVRVQESSLAFEGAHVWISFSGPGAAGERMEQFSVDAAKQISAALDEFIADAEAGRLTEPAKREGGNAHDAR